MHALLREAYDEVQLVPEIFRPLKIMIDHYRGDADGGRGKFLLTGSASIMALPALSDALVGRMALHTLLPFSMREISVCGANDFIEQVFAADWDVTQTDTTDLNTMLTRASFPELLSLNTVEARHTWCDSYLNTLLQRDVRTLLEVDKLAVLPNLLRLIATHSGSILNTASLSRTIGLNHVTTKKYCLLLNSLFLTLSIPAWSVNLGKRLVKSPKIYLTDINLLGYLLNIHLNELHQQNPMLLGQVLENAVAIELSKQIAFSKTRVHLYHYRTSAGQEVDFILEDSRGRVVAIEVKASSKVTANDFRHVLTLKDALGKRFHRGFIIYQGADSVAFANDLFAIPFNALWA